jgi:hypothetical protein
MRERRSMKEHRKSKFENRNSKVYGDGLKKQPTTNIERPTSNLRARGRTAFIGCSMLDVRCWMFPQC